MKKSTFFKEVKVELDAIKKNATQEEIQKLDFTDFNHQKVGRCIYGQMTGYCFSKRANEIQKKKYKDLGFIIDTSFEGHNFTKGNKYTALEKYLFMVSPDKHLEIIQYLKGEINEIIID